MSWSHSDGIATVRRVRKAQAVEGGVSSASQASMEVPLGIELVCEEVGAGGRYILGFTSS